jgi:DNA primase
VPDQPVRLLVMTLPGAKDPDELIRADPAEWPGLVQAARPVIDFVLDRLAQRYDLGSAHGKAAAADEVTDILAAIADPIEQAHYVQRVADLLGVGQEAVQRALRRKRSSAGPTKLTAPPTEREGDRHDEYALALLLRLRQVNVAVDTANMDMLLLLDENRALLRALEAGEPPGPELQPYLDRAEAMLPQLEGFGVERLNAILEETRLWLEERALERRRAELKAAMSGMPEAEQIDLLPRLQEIARRLGEIDERQRSLQLGRRAVEAA